MYITDNLIRKDTDTLLFFTPEAGVSPHYVTQCLLARTYQELGYKVAMASCRGILRRCPVMDMYLAPHDTTPEAEHLRQGMCQTCVNNSNITSLYGLPRIELHEFVTPELRNEFNTAMASAKPNLLEFEHDGIHFGRLSARDVVFSKKCYDFSAPSPEESLAWRNYVETSLATYLIARELFKRISVGRLFYYNEYSSSLGAILAARNAGISVRSITNAPFKGVAMDRLVFMSEPFQSTQRWMLDNWGSWRDLPLSAETIRMVTDDLLHRSSGKSSFVYSSGKSDVELSGMLRQIGLSDERRTLVAFTSSMDEFAASSLTAEGLDITVELKPQPFRDQASWLEHLIEYIRARPNLQLVVRIHPREGKTKRDPFESRHLQTLKARLNGSYERCKIIWPDDPISSYDLAETADLILTSWSTIGLEMARCGVPVVTSFQELSFPNDDFLRFGGETPNEYDATLDASLRDTSASLEAICRAYRCFFMFNLSFALPFDDHSLRGDGFQPVPFVMPQEAPTLERLLHGPETTMEVNYQRMLSSSRVDFDELYKYEAIRIIFQFMGIQEHSPVCEPLTVGETVELHDYEEAAIREFTQRDVKSCVVIATERELSIFIAGQVYRKRSRLLGRLGMLLSSICPAYLSHPTGTKSSKATVLQNPHGLT